MSIVVRDASEALPRITAVVQGEGGYVAETKQWQAGGQIRATATLRIPAEKLSDVMAAIRREGLRVVSENVSGEDVSEEFVDVQARLNNLLATEEELRKVLIEIRARTQRAADVLEVHKEITRVREDIDRLQGRTNYLKQMTAMSTVKLELIPDQLYQPLVEPGWQPFAIAMTAARSFVASMKWLGTILIWVVVFALPLGLVLAGLTLSANMIWKPIRRWRMSQQTPPQA